MVAFRSRRVVVSFVAILLVAAVARTVTVLALPNINHPDEIFQTLEQAHRLAFGYGIVPWEFREAARSWALPGILAVPMAVAGTLGAGPTGITAAVQLALAALSLGVVAGAFVTGLRIGLPHAIVAGGVAAIWSELLYHAGRTLSETVATTPLVLALALAGTAAPRRAHLLGIGLMLGACVVLRVHLAPAALLIAGWMAWREGRRALLPIIAGGLIPLAISGVVDWVTWGTPFVSTWNNLRFNLIEGGASRFGDAPPEYYLTVLHAGWGTMLLLVIGMLTIVGARRLPLWLATSVVIIGTHSLIGHKEPRFIAPAVACLVILAAIGSAESLLWLVRRLPDPDRGRTRGAVAVLGVIVLLAGWSVTSWATANRPGVAYRWTAGRAMMLASHLLHDQADLCGVGLGDLEDWRSAGYAHLHRDVPYLSGAVLEHPEAVSHLLLRGDTPAPGAPWTLLTCFQDPLGGVCVYRRAGGCSPPGPDLQAPLA